MSSWRLPAFEEVRELGSGGSGRVVLARHLPSGTEVAIKYLAAWLADDDELLAAFRSEARLMAGLVDPHLVTLHEYVETAAGAAIVMDLLEGVSLRRMLDSDGPLTPEAALTLLKGSLLGLAALHRHEIAHRDYKPDNVIVDDAGRTTLIDYGIAAPVGEVAAASGTPRYMAPEQWRGEPSSAATDVYAATATFVECLTGRPVFSGSTAPHLMHQHLNTPPPLDDVPEAVRPLAVVGLAKEPVDRITDAEAFVAQLETLAPAVYGEQWEQRGREHLAARAALLALLFAHPRTAGAEQAHAQTDLGTSSAPSDLPDPTAGAAADGGDRLDAAVGPPRRAHGGAGSNRGPRAARFARVRNHRSTLVLGLLLLVAAVFAAMHVNGPTYATSAAFDTGTPTRAVPSPALPTPSPTPSTEAPAEPSATPTPPVRVTPSASVSRTADEPTPAPATPSPREPIRVPPPPEVVEPNGPPPPPTENPSLGKQGQQGQQGQQVPQQPDPLPPPPP